MQRSELVGTNDTSCNEHSVRNNYEHSKENTINVQLNKGRQQMEIYINEM